jgi:hypothetical protein
MNKSNCHFVLKQESNNLYEVGALTKTFLKK